MGKHTSFPIKWRIAGQGFSVRAKLTNRIPDNSYYQELHFSRIKWQLIQAIVQNSPIRLQIQAAAMPCSEIQSTHYTTERDTMDEQQQNTEEMIDGLVRSERMAHAIGQTPKYIKDEIASLVEGEQIPGSFGDLIKRSVEMTKPNNELEDTNVVSIFSKRATQCPNN